MENKLKITALLIVFFFPIFCHSIDGDVSKVEGMEAVREGRHPIIETAMKLFSLPTSFPDSSAYWKKVDSLIRQGRTLFSAPNLDFRPKKDGEEGTGEKVKEAMVKSKTTMEDSAKSAAKLTGETVDKATQKLKKTLANKYQDSNEESEL